jgi:cephalosporin hydroxylase
METIAEQIPKSRRAMNDIARQLRFHLRFIKKKKLMDRRRGLREFADYFQFSRKVFNLVQIQSEIEGLVKLVSGISPKIVCEIGTRSCGTSFLLSQAVPGVEVFIGLDLYVSNWSQFRAFARPGQQVTALTGSSYDPTTVKRVEQILAGRKIDMLFIDGDHSYDGVKKDFDLYSPMVRQGGLIALHDIMPDHRERDGRTTGPYSGGVPKMWNEIKAKYPSHEFIGSPDQEGFGIGAIEFSSRD